MNLTANSADKALREALDIVNLAYLDDKITRSEAVIVKYAMDEVFSKIVMSCINEVDYEEEKHREQFNHTDMLEEIYHD